MSAIFASMSIGFFATFLSWQVYTLFRDVPTDDRHFMDRPAVGFRLTWPLINLFVHYFGGFLSNPSKQTALMKLRKAGMEFTVSPVQFLASKYIAALIVFIVIMIAGFSLEKNLLVYALTGSVLAFFYPELWLRETSNLRRAQILKSLPFYLDIITLAVEAGSNLTGGISQAVQKSADSPLRREFSRILRDVRAGRSRAEALHDFSERSGSSAVQNIVGGLVQAEKTGSSLGALLRAQSEQLRVERFQRAEKLAMEAPVKLLGPLVMFIFPNTFLVLIFLLVSKGVQEGVLTWPFLVWLYSWPG